MSRQAPLILPLGMALMSYIPFEIVAKVTLVVLAVLFVVDPFPPVSRLVSVISLVVVAGLTRWYTAVRRENQENDGISDMVQVQEIRTDEKRKKNE